MVSQWYYVPPPYNMDKPISLAAPPMGAVNTGSASPYDTIQVIGRSRIATVPQSVSIDMGVSDAFITEYGRRIAFQGKGSKTNVGTRIEDVHTGMSIPEVGDELTDEDYAEMARMDEPMRGSRATFSKKKPARKHRKDDWLTQLTSVGRIG